MRVVTWNVWGLRGGARRAAATLRAAHADVVCLQECPRTPAGWIRLRLLAARAGLRVVCGGGRHGVAVLVRPGVAVTAANVERERRRWRGWWWEYPRATAWVRLDVPGGPVWVASVHLAVDGAARLAHARRLTAWLRGAEVGVVAGDLNEAPGGPVWQELLSAGGDADPGGSPTYPLGRGRRPRNRIDAVVVRGLDVREVRLGSVTALSGPGDSGSSGGRRRRPASDHRPVLAVLATAAPRAVQ